MCVQTEVLLLETLMHVTHTKTANWQQTRMQHVCKRNASRCCQICIQTYSIMYMAKPYMSMLGH